MRTNIYFSDYFNIDPNVLDDFGVFNISVINDLPLFIDPFLLFNSEKEEYQRLHNDIIKYLRFLRDKSIEGKITTGLLLAWYHFKEVKQTWLGYSLVGNKGSGLGMDFAISVNENLARLFSNFGSEQVTLGSHLEKLCLVNEGIGKDNISDFTTNLIKEYLLEYTQKFTLECIDPAQRSNFNVPKVRFNYQSEHWESAVYVLPNCEDDYVILTPMHILSKDNIWINREDLVRKFREVAESVSNEQLRAELNNYLEHEIPKDAKAKEKEPIIAKAYRIFPELLEYYIRYKEDHGDEAEALSGIKVEESRELYIDKVIEFITALASGTEFYNKVGDTLEEARQRVYYMKHVIENQDGYRLFYVNDTPIKREDDLHLIFKFTWFATPSDVNAEVNNGQGPVDFKVSRGALDKSLIEFKLASNSQLKRNLQNQVPIYEKANATQKALKVIIYFTEQELSKVDRILKELEMYGNENIILIDARRDNKPAASKA